MKTSECDASETLAPFLQARQSRVQQQSYRRPVLPPMRPRSRPSESDFPSARATRRRGQCHGPRLRRGQVRFVADLIEIGRAFKLFFVLGTWYLVLGAWGFDCAKHKSQSSK